MTWLLRRLACLDTGGSVGVWSHGGRVNGTRGVSASGSDERSLPQLIVDWPQIQTQPSCGSPSSLSQLVWLNLTSFTLIYLFFKILTCLTQGIDRANPQLELLGNLPGEDGTSSTGEWGRTRCRWPNWHVDLQRGIKWLFGSLWVSRQSGQVIKYVWDIHHDTGWVHKRRRGKPGWEEKCGILFLPLRNPLTLQWITCA